VPILGIVGEHELLHLPALQRSGSYLWPGGGSRAAEQLGIPFLGEVPLDLAIERNRISAFPSSWPNRMRRARRTLRQMPKRWRRQVSIRTYEAPVSRWMMSARRTYKLRPHEEQEGYPGELMIQWADGHETHHLAPVLRGIVPAPPVKTR